MISWFLLNQIFCNKQDSWWEPGCGISNSDRAMGHVNEVEGIEDAKWGGAISPDPTSNKVSCCKEQGGLQACLKRDDEA